jgi:hypothetical protein
VGTSCLWRCASEKKADSAKGYREEVGIILLDFPW